MYKHHSEKTRYILSLIFTLFLLLALCFIGTLDYAGASVTPTATFERGIETVATPEPTPTPFPTPHPIFSCWVYGPGILMQCDEPPCRPLEPCDTTGTGTLPLQRSDHQVFLPSVVVPCGHVGIRLEGENVIIYNKACENFVFRAHRLISDGSGRRCWLAGMIEPNRQVTIKPVTCGFPPNSWMPPIRLLDYEKNIVAIIE